MVTKDELNYDYLFKIVIIGESGTGKTNILSRFTRDEFSFDSRSTIGVEFAAKNVKVKDNKVVKAQIWDTAGQEKYKAISKAYYRGALGCLLVYDISSSTSFEKANNWYKELKEGSSQNIQILLVGNKCDLEQERQVKKEQAIAYAQQHNMSFIETSALNNTNIEQAFKQIIQQIYEQLPPDEINQPIIQNARNIKEQNNIILAKSEQQQQQQKIQKKQCC